MTLWSVHRLINYPSWSQNITEGMARPAEIHETNRIRGYNSHVGIFRKTFNMNDNDMRRGSPQMLSSCNHAL